jgi:peroxiredoxin Q/BCP
MTSITLTALVALAMFFPMRLFSNPIELGTRIPDVTVQSHEDKPVNLAEVGKEGFLFVYFYPRADTPGCTAQACSLRDAYETITDKGVRVFGVSMDSVADQAAFREKHQIPFTLLADREGALVRAFGVPYAGTAARRQAFLFRDGVLVWRDTSASTRRQAEDVLAALAGL